MCYMLAKRCNFKGYIKKLDNRVIEMMGVTRQYFIMYCCNAIESPAL